MAGHLITENFLEKAAVFTVGCCALGLTGSPDAAASAATAATSMLAIGGVAAFRAILGRRPECEAAVRKVLKTFPREFQLANDANEDAVRAVAEAMSSAMDQELLLSPERFRNALNEQSRVVEALTAEALRVIVHNDEQFDQPGLARDFAESLLPRAFAAAWQACEEFRWTAALTLQEFTLEAVRDVRSKVEELGETTSRAGDASRKAFVELSSDIDELRNALEQTDQKIESQTAKIDRATQTIELVLNSSVEENQRDSNIAQMISHQDYALRRAYDTAKAGAKIGDTRFKEIVNLFSAGRSQESEHLFQLIAAEKGAECERAIREAALAYRNLGAIALLDEPRRALSAYETALKFDPGDSVSMLWIGLLQLDRATVSESEANFRRILSSAKSGSLP